MLCDRFRSLWLWMIDGSMTFRFAVLTRIVITDIINENIDKNKFTEKDAADDRMETGGNLWQGQWESEFRILAR